MHGETKFAPGAVSAFRPPHWSRRIGLSPHDEFFGQQCETGANRGLRTTPLFTACVFRRGPETWCAAWSLVPSVPALPADWNSNPADTEERAPGLPRSQIQLPVRNAIS